MITRHNSNYSGFLESRSIELALLVMGYVAAGLAILMLLAFGFAGVGRGGGEFGSNVGYFYTAGKAWISGNSPYNFDLFVPLAQDSSQFTPESNFAYPPSISLVSSFLAIFPYSVAKVILGALNILSIGVLCWAALKISSDRKEISLNKAHSLLILALIIGNPFSAHIAWLGQTSLMVTALVALAFILAGQRKVLVPGILLGIASVKPQISILIGFWFLMEKRFALIFIAAVTAAILSLPAIISSGFLTYQEWFLSLNAYTSGEHDQVSFRHVFGMRSLLADFGLHTPNLLPLAVLLTGLLFWKKESVRREDVLSILILLSIGFVYAHDYDIAIGMFAAGSFWFYLKGRFWLVIAALIPIGYICFPQRFVLHFYPEIGHYREPAFFFMLLCLILLMFSHFNQKTANASQ